MAMSAASEEPMGSNAEKASPIRPLRAIEVHDSRVRRIAATTPDMIGPKETLKNARLERKKFTPGATPAVLESNENSPFVTPRVRVQTVNVNQVVENCAPFLENFRQPCGHMLTRGSRAAI